MEPNTNNMVMPVAPMGYGGYGFPFGGMGGFGGMDMFGGNGWWIILLFLVLGRGFGGGYGGGYGMGGGAPIIINNSDDDNNGGRGYNAVQRGFDQAAVMGGINGIQSAVTTGFGNVQTSLCSGFAGVNATVNGAQNAIAQQLYANQLADLERSFAAQTAAAQGFTGVNTGIADLRYTEATEGCATRTAAAQNTRDIIDAQNRGTQAILDKLCALELDGVKGQLAAAQRENVGLQNQLNIATMQASQIEQTAQIRAGQNAAVTSLVNELRSCPIPAQPVYGSQPIFTCPQTASGCGCNGGFVA